MDIGEPLRDLGPVDVAGIMRVVKNLSEADWTANTFRQDALAASVHSVTDTILMKTEWHPSATSTGIGHLEDLVHVWAKERGLDPKLYLPIAREDTARFEAIPGIGRKTAQRVVLELKGTLSGDIEPTAEGDGHLVARDALVELGYTLVDAESVLAAIDPALPPEERVRLALRQAA